MTDRSASPIAEADRLALVEALRVAGCVAAEEEATDLLDKATGREHLATMLRRRRTGEPLAWITGTTRFCGVEITVLPGVYVPRWQSESLAAMAAELLPADGTAVDLCTGSGAVAAVLQHHRRRARVLATEVDRTAVACARRNGVAVRRGHLDEPLPADLADRVDVMTGVVPYVPTGALRYLPSDVRCFESRSALDGGDDGLAVVSEVVRRSRRWVKVGGHLLLEAGSDQVDRVAVLFARSGYAAIGTVYDDDGDGRGVFGRRLEP